MAKVFAPQSLPVGNADVVDDVNHQTHGTEFYGTSSNFVLLNQFFAYAQHHLPPGHARSSNHNDTSYLSPASCRASEPSSLQDHNSPWTFGRTSQASGIPARSPVSIVNLLSNDETLEPPSRSKTPLNVTENQAGGPRNLFLAPSCTRNGTRLDSTQYDTSPSSYQQGPGGDSASNPRLSTHLATEEKPVPESSLQGAKKRLEREYVRLFLSNLHHIHPMLDPIAFTARCEEEIWDANIPLEKSKNLRHFFALYNVVIAVGALVSGSSISQSFERDINLCMKQPNHGQNSSLPLSSQMLSKKYFRKSRALLGDFFEVCSLESAQTLLLMVGHPPAIVLCPFHVNTTKSLYCQNSLKPHACYMYCGHAVRTALAIGIARESTSNSLQDRKAARRTWWCIYSHEIDMSCSAGRRDSLGKPRNYQIDLPCIRSQDQRGPPVSEDEDYSVAMINEMVHFAFILRRISKELYYDSKGLTLLQKSAVAKELDTLLDNWKARLPRYLNFGTASFREEEWAAKQKLVLHLRYLNAKILLHRPFLEAPLSRTKALMSRHVDLCLAAARDTIRVMYEAYTNRHYFRTWWYNSTYTLYAGMIVLYVVMLGYNDVSSDELLNDVVKTQEILQSMEEAIVARRSAILIQEGLEVARACVQSQQNQSTRPEVNPEKDHHGLQNQPDLNNTTSHAGNDFSRALFSQAVPGQDPALFASIIDPNLLQDFTAADKDIPGLDFSTFPFDASYGEVDLELIML